MKKKVVLIKFLDHALFLKSEPTERRPIKAAVVGFWADEDENSIFVDLNKFEDGQSDTMVIVKTPHTQIQELAEVELD